MPVPALTTEHVHDLDADSWRDAIALYRAVLWDDLDGIHAILGNTCARCLALACARWGVILSQTDRTTNGRENLDYYLARAQAVTVRDTITLWS